MMAPAPRGIWAQGGIREGAHLLAPSVNFQKTMITKNSGALDFLVAFQFFVDIVFVTSHFWSSSFFSTH